MNGRRSSPPIVDAETLRQLVDFTDLIEPVGEAFRQSSAGRAENGLIVSFPANTREAGDVYVKTGVLRGHRVFVTKVSPWFAVNVARGHPQGGFLSVFDATTGHTLAILDEQHYLSDIRTAAAGAIAARALAPPEVRQVGVLGTGVQARWQCLALYHERPFTKLLIWGRDRSKAQASATELAPRLPGVTISLSESVEEVVRSADVVLTTTLSRDPIVRGEWLRPGQHITAVGADDPTKCELDAAALKRSAVFVDHVDTSVANGDVFRAISSERYARSMIAGEIGHVLSGDRPGRTSSDQITIAKFVGIGAQDLVAAEVALTKLGILTC